MPDSSLLLIARYLGALVERLTAALALSDCKISYMFSSPNYKTTYASVLEAHVFTTSLHAAQLAFGVTVLLSL